MSKSDQALFQEMMEQHERMISRGEELASFRSIVNFRIPAVGLSRWRYHHLLLVLLIEFVEQADPRNKEQAKVMKYHGLGRPNEEGGIGCLTIDRIFIGHCKMYFCDGTRESRTLNPEGKWKPWRGLIFRDHDSNLDTAKVFTIADAFEKFLQSKNIKFRRINWERKK